MKKLLPLGLAALLAGCSLVAPYTITFTNTPGSVVSPTTTLDLVVSQPTLAYISDVECEGADSVEFLPIVDQDEEPSTLHKLPLTALEGMPSGSTCEVTVTVFDPTTTETAASTIELTMEGEAAVEEETELESEESSEEEATEENTESTEETPVESTVEVETTVETPTESIETPSETNDSAESTDTTGTEEQGA